MGRPTLLTPELQKEICRYIENGNSIQNSCILCGISESSYHEWVRIGKEDQASKKNSVYSEFMESTIAARAKNKAWHIQNITQASKKDWKASAWYMERVYHKEFGRKDSLKVQGNFNVRNFDLELTQEEQAAYRERMASVFGDDIQDMMGADIGEQDD